MAIGKRVSVHSTQGAAATVIHGGGRALRVVCIEASGVVFGQSHMGFTLVAGGVGVGVGETGQPVNNVRLAGNLATTVALMGFLIVGGSGHVVSGNLAIDVQGDGFDLRGTNLEVTNNQAIANDGAGFRAASGSSTGGFTLSGNTASGNGADGFANLGRRACALGESREREWPRRLRAPGRRRQRPNERGAGQCRGGHLRRRSRSRLDAERRVHREHEHLRQQPGLGGGPGQLWPPESIEPRGECWQKLLGRGGRTGPGAGRRRLRRTRQHDVNRAGAGHTRGRALDAALVTPGRRDAWHRGWR